MTDTQATFPIVITCADGLELPLQSELASFGIDATQERIGRLTATLTLAKIYQVCLWSRVASRVFVSWALRRSNQAMTSARVVSLCSGV